MTDRPAAGGKGETADASARTPATGSASAATGSASAATGSGSAERGSRSTAAGSVSTRTAAASTATGTTAADEARDPILTVERLDLGYGQLQVVYDVSLRLGRHELVGLVGGNGSGKSSILRAISGMITPWQGSIRLDGEIVNGRTPHEMAARGLAHVPMGRQLFPNMTVEENLSLGAYLPRARASRQSALERVYGLFPDLLTKRREPAGALSGGQQQMVAIARALMLSPKVLIMDEPSLGLAPLLVKEVMQVIRRVSETGLPILLVEQNVMQVLKIADRAYVLENGRLVTEGPARALMDDPEVKRAYLGL